MSLRFTTDGMVVQRFSLPTPITDYIFNNAEPRLLVKFYKSCKFFYAKYRRNLIKNLVLLNENKFEILDENVTILSPMSRVLEEIKDFEIFNSFAFYSKPISFYNFGHFIRELVCGCFLTWDDFEKLTVNDKIEEIVIHGVFANGVAVNEPQHLLNFDQMVPIEDIFERIPNAKSILINNTRVTQNTGTKMMSLNHNVKIKNIGVHDIFPYTLFNVNDFINFINKHYGNGCAARITFKIFEIDDHPDHAIFNSFLSTLEISDNTLIASVLNAKKMAD